MSAPLTDTDGCITALTEGIQIKVWSYITTILGDLAAGDPTAGSGDVSGQVLRVLTERIGIRPEATRVALHRLRKDAWIVVRKEGRGSHYRFSGDRLAETRAAASRIYAQPGPPPARWCLTLGDPQASLDADENAILLQPNATLSLPPPTPDPRTITALVAHDSLPSWAHLRAISPEWQDEYAQLAALFGRVNDSLAPLNGIDDRDAMSLRLLAVHRWRRLILRHPIICEQVQPRDWIGVKARAEFSALLARLPRVPPERITQTP